jgi:hypothetical protein
MAMRKPSAVIGVFDTREQGHRAVEELRREGFAEHQITLVAHHHPRPGEVDVTDMDAAKAAQVSGETRAEEGAVVGAVAGGLAGAAVALATGLIPGVGPALGLGWLAALVFGGGAAIGVVGGGIVGALVGLDFPEEEARFYEQELKAGKTLVGVKAGDRAADARAILERCGGHEASSLQVATPADAENPPVL